MGGSFFRSTTGGTLYPSLSRAYSSRFDEFWSLFLRFEMGGELASGLERNEWQEREARRFDTEADISSASAPNGEI